jgi:hypothetical protein
MGDPFEAAGNRVESKEMVCHYCKQPMVFTEPKPGEYHWDCRRCWVGYTHFTKAYELRREAPEPLGEGPNPPPPILIQGAA